MSLQNYINFVELFQLSKWVNISVGDEGNETVEVTCKRFQNWTERHGNSAKKFLPQRYLETNICYCVHLQNIPLRFCTKEIYPDNARFSRAERYFTFIQNFFIVGNNIQRQ